jgi:serine/threonine protein kinase
MLSPLASSNLKVYWRTTRPRLADADFILWQLRQLSGLADALRYIYNLGGYHHDLKGENILCFEEGDFGSPTLKIADFGSAKIHARRSGPRDGSNPTRSYYQGTSAYEAPDYVIRGETSRPYDVWTLGCIYLEMLIWTFGSQPSELDTFSNARRRIVGGRLGSDTMFWYVEFDGNYYTTHWKPAVRNKLRTLEDHCDSDKGRAVFKELVLTTSKMLRMDPSIRPKPYEVHNDMDRITLWAEEAVKKPDWKIQNLLIGATPSTAKSETSGEADGDGVPVRASLGHLMMEKVAVLERPFRPVLSTMRQPASDGTDLKFLGSRENLDLEGSRFHLIVDEVDDNQDGSTPRPENRNERLLYGSHLISPDRDAYGEARTVVSSAVASQFHLPLKPPLSIPFERREGFPIEASGSTRRRSSFS